MRKAQLIERISEDAQLSKKAAAGALETTFGAIAEAMGRDESVSLPGFGTFQVRHRAARTGRHPGNGSPIQIPASKSVGFKPSKALNGAL